MKRLWQKIRSQVGDSMVETLAAILIAALGATLLVTMVMSAMNVIGTNESTMTGLYQDEAAVASTSTGNGTLSIKNADSGIVIDDVAVVVYESGDFTRYEPLDYGETP